MKTSRREFIGKLGLTGIAAWSLQQHLSASDYYQQADKNTENKGLTILFQGDSITDGNRTRDNDWNHIMGHGYAYLIACRLWYDYIEENLMFYNRGISGNRVRDLDARWQQDTLDLKPDVLSILIGVNDVMAIVKDWDPDPIEKFEESYKKILDKTLSSLPNTQIVLCEPFILPIGWVNEKTEIWQTEVLKRQQVVRKLAETYQTTFVELQKPFEQACQKAPANYWIWDGVHPMPAGHELIARLWIKEVSKKLSFIKNI
jgi:lysophospholipase L1-like esterase